MIEFSSALLLLFDAVSWVDVRTVGDIGANALIFAALAANSRQTILMFVGLQ